MAYPFAENWRRWVDQANAFWSKVLRVVRPLLFLLILVVGMKEAYQELDKVGCVRHYAVSPVSISGDWFVGEFRNCYTVVEKSGQQGSLDCAGDKTGAMRTLPVYYWGRLGYLDRVPGYEEYENIQWQLAAAWKCQRKSESLTCWAQ